MSDDFLSRWSRRKRGAEAEVPEPPEEPVSEPAEEQNGEESDAEVLARLGLKHPEEMEAGDDFAAFLRAAVPKHLKRVAYRRLWRSNPTLACLDGLNDYDGDFTGTGVPSSGLKTTYEVGRGFLQRVAAAAETAEADAADAGSEPAQEADGTEAADEDAGFERVEAVQSAESVQGNDTVRTTRRKMVFRSRG